jgi:hypothetical protein
LAIYNVSSHIGFALGADYLGHFSLVSGNATIKLPVNVGRYVQEYVPVATFATNLIVTPFALAGVGTGLSGTGNSSVTTIEDVGAYLQFGKLWGGKFNVGGCYGQWDSAGAYSGKRMHAFIGWSKGF